MHIIYNDENDRLTPEIWKLMEQAFERAMENEFGEELASEGVSLPDIDAELGVSVVDRDEILELNREYRQRDRVTDVLSFPQFDGHDELLEDLLDDETETLIGDVVICEEVCEAQAKEYGHSIEREIIYLFTHSVFHLLGYDHETEEDKADMRAREEEVMSLLGLER